MFWDNFFLFATGSFDSLPQGDQILTYSFNIYKKGYKANPISVLCSGNPLIHRYLTDEPTSAVKGSEIELSIINQNGELPLSTFYADEDNTFKISVNVSYYANLGDVTQTTYNIFNGYLVQEDCQEELTDFGHEIKLVFTDNLGVLKNVSFNDANKTAPLQSTSLRQDIMAVFIGQPLPNTYDNTFVYVSKTTGAPQVGDYVTIQRAGAANGTYEIIKVGPYPLLPGYKLQIRENPPGTTMSAASALVSYVTASDLTWRIKISDIIRICLFATNLQLDIRYSGNLLPVDGATTFARFLENTQIDARTFYKDGTWDNCYTVLEKISAAFGLTFMQAEGVWHVLRFNELRYYNNQMGYFAYDSYMNYSAYYSPYTKAVTYNAGNIETGATETLIRPYQSVTEKLTYEQIPETIYNGTLKDLGPYIRQRSFTTDGVAYYDCQYEAPGFELMPGLTNTYEVLIHVIKRQDNGDEVDRFLRIEQITGTPSVERKVIRTKKIEINQGALLKIKYQFVPWNTGGADIYNFFQIEKATTSADKYFINDLKNDDNQYGWKDLASLNFGIPGRRPRYYSSSATSVASYPEDFIVPTQVPEKTLESQPVPFDGIFYFYLGINSVDSGKPAIQDYRSMSIEMLAPVTKTNIIGHQNKAYIAKTLSNQKSTDIYCDNTEKNYLKGTLLLNSLTNLIQNRTKLWKDGQTSTTYSLGEIITKQEQLWRNKIRSKAEVSLFPIVKNYLRVKPFDVIIFGPLANKNFIFGKLEYDYRANKIKGTLYEMWKTGESTAVGIAQDPEVKYEFKYLYK